jgi:hypothetical protein
MQVPLASVLPLMCQVLFTVQAARLAVVQVYPAWQVPHWVVVVTDEWAPLRGGARWQASQAVATPVVVQLGVDTLPR